MKWKSEKTGEVIGFDDGVHHYAAVDEERASCHPYHEPTKPCNPECRIYVPLPKDGYPWVRVEDQMGPEEFKKIIMDMAHRANNPLPEYKLADVLVHSSSGSPVGNKPVDGTFSVRYVKMHVPVADPVIRMATRSMTCMTAEEWRSRPDLSGVFNAVNTETGEPVWIDDAPKYDEMDARLAKAYANWIIGPLKAHAVDGRIPLEPERLRELAHIVEFTDVVSFSSAAKDVLPEMIRTGDDAWTCIARLGLAQTSDEDKIRESAKKILERFPDKVKEYRGGKRSLLGMFVGELMRASDPKPNPKMANEILRELLEST
jgi:hypothetical protein